MVAVSEPKDRAGGATIEELIPGLMAALDDWQAVRKEVSEVEREPCFSSNGEKGVGIEPGVSSPPSTPPDIVETMLSAGESGDTG